MPLPGERARFLVSLDDTLRALDDPVEIARTVVRELGAHLGADHVAYVEAQLSVEQGQAQSEVLRVPLREGAPAEIRVGSCSPRRWTEEEVELVERVAGRCRDWVRLARTIRGARENEERLSLIMSNVRDHAIFTMDPSGRMTAWNIGAERVFGWTAEEMLGQDAWRLFTPEDQANERPRIELELAAQGRIADNERYHMRKDGTRFFSTGSLEALRAQDGELRGFIKVVRDISEKRRIEEERERLLLVETAARSEAERVGRMKDEFLATLSHELRTPLTSILGWAQLLGRKSPSLPEQLRHGIEIIQRNARTQAQLIDDLLDMNRIVSGHLRLELEAVDPAVVLRTTLDIVGSIALAKGVHIGVEVSPDTGRIWADGSRLQQVLWNLLHNAIKFTNAGGRVQITLERSADEVIFRVADTGKGLQPDFLPHIFERFRQADASTTRRHGGLGLGLSIVKHLVDLHQGRVWAESEGEGKGSTFCVALPVLPREEPRTPVGPEPGEPVTVDLALRGVCVLVVEDEHDTLALLQELLSSEGASVRPAESAEQALAHLQENGVDVLVSDIGMPGMDGYELMHRVRALPVERGGGVPALALTAFARAEDKERALAAGYQVHLSKPIEPDELVSSIRRLLAH